MDLQPGTPVIYRLTKHSRKPGPRAKNVSPSRHGDDYTYLVDKFWVVDEVLEEGKVLRLKTRRGKVHLVRHDDVNLRRPSWWERILYRSQFPIDPTSTNSPASD